MSSRLVHDMTGRLLVEVTTGSPGLDVGDRFVVLGTAIGAAESRIFFLGETTGVRPSPEQAAPRVGGARLPAVRAAARAV